MPPAARHPLALGCLFLSGFSALVFEICWIRESALIFGSTTDAVSTVLAAFFGGLALGSWIFGGLSQRTTRPLRWYAGLEIAVAVMALATPIAFHAADALYGVLYRTLADRPAGLVVARAVLVAAILLPPTTLMGASLPLFCRQFVASRHRIAGSVGLLYAINTLGAAAGCWATGFLLLPWLGAGASIGLAAALNVAAAVTVAGLGFTVTPAARASVETSTAITRGDRFAVHGIFFGAGFVALGSEVMWTRFLGLVVRNTVFTYTITLTVVLVGIVLGSLIASRLFDRSWPRGRWLGGLQVANGLYVVTLMSLGPRFWEILSGGAGVLSCVALMLPSAALSGATFPLAVRLVLDDPARAGIGVGRMAAINTLGGIAGALVIGFTVLPVLGLEATLLGLTGLSLVLGFGAWSLLDRKPLLPGVAAAVIACGLWLGMPWLTGTRLPADFLAGGRTLVDYREGRASNVAVIRSGDVTQMEIDRWWQGEDRKQHQIMVAHVPAILHADPRDVLVVGVGAGQTASRFLMHGIERLDCVDLEPAVFDMIEAHFDGSWMADARVRLIRADGRSYLAHTDRRYDIISLEVGQLFRPGVASFYTADFYRRARGRLRPGGLLTQLVPLPFLTELQLRRVAASFLEAFPESVLWFNTSELLLIGAESGPITLRDDRLRQLTEVPAIHDDLAYAYWGGPLQWLNRPEVFAGGFLLGGDRLRALAGDAASYRDDRPELEYATSRVGSADTLEVALVPLLERHLDPIQVVLAGERSPEMALAAERIRAANLQDIIAHALLRQVEVRRGDLWPQQIAGAMEEALRHNPDNVACRRAMADALLAAGNAGQALEHLGRALAVRPDDVRSLLGAGYIYLQSGRLDSALAALERAVAIDPEDALAHNLLGAALGQSGRLAEAVEHFERALALDPDMEGVRGNLERTREALAAQPG